MNFRFSNLLGAPYRGGTLLIHNNELLTPVGNRVGQVRPGPHGEVACGTCKPGESTMAGLSIATLWRVVCKGCGAA